MNNPEASERQKSQKDEYPSPELDRFQQSSKPLHTQTHGFQGWPAGGFTKPTQPIRYQPSADINGDVSRFFKRGDSPTDRLPSPVKQPPAPIPEEDRKPPPLKLEEDKQKPDWLQGPSRVQENGETQRFDEEYNTQRRGEPIIRDPLRELTSAERNKKIREVQIARQDLAEAARRKREREEERKEDQRKPRYDPMERESPSRVLREQDMKMDRVRQNLDQVRNGYSEDRREEGVSQQDVQLMKLQDEINQLRDHPQFMRPAGLPSLPREGLPREELKRDINPEMRAQSGFQHPFYLYASTPWSMYEKVGKLKFLGVFYMKEPPTDRYAAYRSQRDRDFWGTSRSPRPGYLNNSSPRRDPVGKWYNDSSTYKQDFDEPFFRRGRHNLGNPNKGEYESYNPFGGPGGGAPRLDATGQRTTQVQRSMNVLGRELDSARVKREFKKEQLNTLGEQAAYERMKKQAEKEYMRQGGADLAENMRGPWMKVGYPKKKPTGAQDNHHLVHAVSNPIQPPPLAQQREYHDYLENQINERNKQKSLSKLEEERQANLHFVEMDKRFEPAKNYGGGAPKGLDYRKVKLDRAIHMPQDTLEYKGRAPFADNRSSNY